MTPLGQSLELLCNEAKQEILFAAPFVKKDVIARLLGFCHPKVTLLIVTRWRPEEIAAGMSDIEVWPMLRDRPSTSMWLRSDLHAKYYRADSRCLVGSANLTSTALGWVSNPNLELLVELDAHDSALDGFEERLLAGCVQVDEALFVQVAEAVRLMEHLKEFADVAEESTVAEARTAYLVAPLPVEAWLPTLRSPGDLYTAYSGNASHLSSASREAALYDLQSLPVRTGFSREVFEACIGVLLLQKPAIKEVDDFVLTPRRFGAVTDLMRRLPCATRPGFNADRSWQTLMRWLRHFLPARYERTVPSHSEVFARVQDVDMPISGDYRSNLATTSRPSRSSNSGGSDQAE